ncbi:MAG: enoyl-CoA hydratase [Acidimicrobiales bacterium]
MTEPDNDERAGEAELIAEIDDGVAILTMNRPERRNALSSTLIRSLLSAMIDLDANEDVGVIVLTGADPAFCAGLDLKELGTAGNSLARGVISAPGHHGPWPPLSTVVVGAVNGPAITGGLEIALACDFLVASERAVFADTHARLGLQPTWGLTVRLPEAVGIRRAREMSATANFVDASTALQWGLVNHVVAHHELVASAVALARGIRDGDHRAIARMMQTYVEGALAPGSAAWVAEWEASQAWQAGGLDSGKVAERRAQVIERGRSQL